MTFKEATTYLYSLVNYEKKTSYKCDKEFSLDRINEVLGKLGNPEKAFRSVLVAGTNAKGSTACFLQALLVSNGYKTGLFTSPHLVLINERIRINDKLISDDDFARVMAVVKKESLNKLTFFEVLTVLAIVFFADEKVNVAVFEVGLGGRLDAVNVLPAILSVITPVDIDHCALLGNDISVIAGEKAGIIKEGKSVVCAAQKDEVGLVLCEEARRRKAHIVFVDDALPCFDVFESENSWDFKVRNGDSYSVSSCAHFQVGNARLALLAADVLEKDYGFSFDYEKSRAGLASVVWPGRCEVIAYENRKIVLDGAHNPHAAQALAVEIGRKFAGEKKVIVFAASADKDFDGVLKELSVLGEDIVVTQTSNSRACSVEELAETGRKYFGNVSVERNSLQALKRACGVILDGVVLVVGSLYLVGEVKGFTLGTPKNMY